MNQRPRKSFSLTSLMLLVLVAALGISQIMLMRRLARTEAELAAAQAAYAAAIANKIQPPGGVPAQAWSPGSPLTVDSLQRLQARLNAAPPKELDKWVVEMQRITGKPLDSPLEKQGCRTDFVNRMGVVFKGLQWQTSIANELYQRAQSLSSTVTRDWQQAAETVLEREFTYPHQVALALIPVDELFKDSEYQVEAGDKYLQRLTQLNRKEIMLWRDQFDEFGGTDLDAAVNIILQDDYFEDGTLLLDKLKSDVNSE